MPLATFTHLDIATHEESKVVVNSDMVVIVKEVEDVGGKPGCAIELVNGDVITVRMSLWATKAQLIAPLGQ